jgi:hypothetical protein
MEQKHLYWALQSSQIENPQEEELKLFQNKYKKDFEKRELYEEDELQTKFRLNGWRNPLFSRVTSIILAFEHEDTLRVKYIQGGESDLLQNFVNLLKNKFQDYQLVHFDAGIVLPYIGIRLQKNGFINPPNIGLKYQGFKPWDLKGLDIKQYFRGAGDYSYSLEEIGYILDIDTKGIIAYEDEFTYFTSGDFETLNNSAVKKIEVLSKVHRKLFSLSELTTVVTKEKVENIQEETPTDWLKELYNANQFTVEIRDGLKQQIFGKKKPTKKEKEHLFTIIRGVYIRTNFEANDQDSKKNIELKEQQIKDLLEL